MLSRNHHFWLLSRMLSHKNGPFFWTDGPVLEFEVMCDRNNFMTFKKLLRRLSIKIHKPMMLTYMQEFKPPTKIPSILYTIPFTPSSLNVLFRLMVFKFLTQIHTRVSTKPNFFVETVLRTLGLSVKDIITKTNLRELTASIPLQEMLVSVWQWLLNQLKQFLLVNWPVTFWHVINIFWVV